MKIAIIGVGSLGSLLAAYLSRVAQVVMVGSWKEQIEAVKRHGVTLLNADNQRHTQVVAVTTYDQLPTEQDVAIVVVKSYQTSSVADNVARTITSDGLAITLQNGVGNLELLDSACGPERSTAGVTTQGARLLEPGVVLDTGSGQTVLGHRETLTAASAHKVMALCELFNEAGLETRTVTNINEILWSKLAVNAAINPLTALLEVPNGVLLSEMGALAIMEAAAREVADVAAAKGILLSGDDLVGMATDVATRTSTNESSMLQDMRRGRPTEIDAICGTVVAQGQDLGVATPVNERLLALVRRKEAGERELSLSSLITLHSFLNADPKR